MLLHFAHHVFSVVYVLYAQHRYGLGPFEVGLMLALAGLLDMGVQGWAVGRAVERFGDRATMVFGLLGGTFGLVCVGLAPNAPLFVAALFPNALWGFAMPTLLSLMTRRVSEQEQGQLQGANNSVASIAGIASPLFFGWVYSVSVSLPGVSFLIAALILAMGAALAFHATRGSQTPAKV